MANETLIDKTAATALVSGDILYAVKDPSGTPLDRKITIDNILDAPLPIGSTTPNTGAFSSLEATSIVSGNWTPELTFATAGDLSVAYTRQVGRYRKIGNMVTVIFDIQTSTFTHTTASGFAQINGLPFTSENVADSNANGEMVFRGINKSGYTDVAASILDNTSNVFLNASGMGQANDFVDAADMPSGGTVRLQGTVVYFT